MYTELKKSQMRSQFLNQSPCHLSISLSAFLTYTRALACSIENWGWKKVGVNHHICKFMVFDGFYLYNNYKWKSISSTRIQQNRYLLQAWEKKLASCT